MSKHTPGPWQAHSDQPGYELTIVGNIDGPLEDFQLNYTTVCDVADTDDADANLRLIAAAPELLDALREVVAMLQREAPGTPLNNMRFDPLAVKCLRAIDKATGAA
jgi:hypothetical protein